MKAVILQKFGSPDELQVKETERPNPAEDEILVKIRAASVNYGDTLARNFKAATPKTFNMPLPLLFLSRLFFGFSEPKVKILGSEFSGVVEETGSKVSGFKKGDEVFGYRGQNMGTYAEYISIKENSTVALKPGNVSFEEAALIPYGSLMSIGLLEKSGLKEGGKVLILGASGGIGSGALQLVKQLYNAEVTAVCGASSAAMVKTLGADYVIDYKQEDFRKNGKQYDLIMDILGRYNFPDLRDSLTPNGVYMPVSFKSDKLFQMLATSITGGRKVKCILSGDSKERLETVSSFVSQGKIKAVVDKVFPMEQAPEAHRYYESGTKGGGVVLSMNGA